MSASSPLPDQQNSPSGSALCLMGDWDGTAGGQEAASRSRAGVELGSGLQSGDNAAPGPGKELQSAPCIPLPKELVPVAGTCREQIMALPQASTAHSAILIPAIAPTHTPILPLDAAPHPQPHPIHLTVSVRPLWPATLVLGAAWTGQGGGGSSSDTSGGSCKEVSPLGSESGHCTPGGGRTGCRCRGPGFPPTPGLGEAKRPASGRMKSLGGLDPASYILPTSVLT